MILVLKLTLEDTDEGLKYTVESSSTNNIFKSTISALIPAIE